MALNAQNAIGDGSGGMSETEIGSYSTGATVTLWNTGGMAPGGHDGTNSFGRTVRRDMVDCVADMCKVLVAEANKPATFVQKQNRWRR